MASYSNSECIICKNEYNDGPFKPFVITPCGHTCCQTCMEKIGNKCPECQGPIITKVINRLSLDLIADIRLRDKQLEANNKLNQIKALINDLEREKDHEPVISPAAFIEFYYTNIENQTIELYKKIIRQATTERTHTLATLKDLKNKALNNISSVKKDDFTQLRVFKIPEWKTQLENVNISLKQIDDLVEQFSEAISSIENRESNYQYCLLMKSKVKLIPAEFVLTNVKHFARLSIICRIEKPFGYYIGEVVDGKEEGKGEYHSNGFFAKFRFEGEYKNGLKNGHGIVYYQVSGIVYNQYREEGSYLNDKKIGEHIHYFEDGKTYRIKYS